MNGVQHVITNGVHLHPAALVTPLHTGILLVVVAVAALALIAFMRLWARLIRFALVAAVAVGLGFVVASLSRGRQVEVGIAAGALVAVLLALHVARRRLTGERAR